MSILFLDITGYARLSELLPPSTLNELIERYFSAFLDEVTDRGGSVNETMGDEFMAIFQQPNPAQNASAAAETALGVLAATEHLNRESKERPIEVHIGISSGGALVGSTQFQGRHGTRWVFSASGRHVNEAARLAGIAQSGQIFVSPATRHRLGDHYIIASEGVRKLKNIEEEIEAFRVVRRVLTRLVWRVRTLDFRFSNRPFGVKHFQTIRRCSAALLFFLGFYAREAEPSGAANRILAEC